MNNETNISLKVTNKVQGNDLDGYAGKLEKLKKIIEKMPKSTELKSLVPKDYTKQLDTIIDKIGTIEKKSNNTSKALNSAFSTAKFSTVILALRKVVNVMGQLTDKSSDYLESINLYQVAFNGATEEADKFVSTLSEMYGLDEAWLIKTIGLFKQLTNAMRLTEEQGTRVSMLLTQMSIDITSLYNSQPDRASQVLQSAMASQTRPIRGLTGADITMSTLQTTLDNLGIDRAVSQLSFAEKRLVIIISLTQQLNRVANDWGKTLESPANQTRILSEQWARLTRAVGNVFLPIIAKVLPYLNAALMVLTEIVNLIARLFGFKQEDYDFGVGIADEILDIEEALDGANESAKALKQGLRGFDKLNVITTPSSDSGTSAGLGVSSDIWGAFDKAYTEYMDKLEKVKMRATEIRDIILDWLGFTDGSYKNLKLIAGILGTIIGLKLIKGIKGLITGTSKLGKLLGTGGLYTVIKNIFSLFSGEVGREILRGKIANGIIKLATLNPTILAVAGSILAIGTALIYAYTHNDKFKEKVDTMVKSVKDMFESLYDVISSICKKIWETIEPAWKLIKDYIILAVSLVYDTIVLVFSDIADIISGTAKIIKDIINGDYNQAFEDAKEMANNLFKNHKEAFEKTYDKISEFVSKAVPKLEEWTTNVITWFTELPEKLGYWTGEAVGKVIKKLSEIDWVEEGKKIIKTIIGGMLDIDAQAENFKLEFKNKITEKLKSIDWADLGLKVLDGILTIGNPKRIFNKFRDTFLAGIKDALGINSPSKLMIDAEIGNYTLQGIEVGMDSELPSLVDQANNIVKEINKSFKKIEPISLDNEIKTNYSSTITNGMTTNDDLQNNLNLKINNNSASKSFNPTFIIQVGDEEVARHTINKMEEMAKANGKPFTIGG